MYMARLPCLFCGMLMVLLISLVGFAYYVFPEIGMVVHSQVGVVCFSSSHHNVHKLTPVDCFFVIVVR
jgi:hypothetical protein